MYKKQIKILHPEPRVTIGLTYVFFFFAREVLAQSPVFTPPALPSQGGGGNEGVVLMFLFFLLAIFVLLVLLIGTLLQLTAKVVTHKEQNFWMVLAVPVSGLIMWLFWEPLRRSLSPLAEWTSIAFLIIFGFLSVIVLLAFLARAFSRENIGTTLTVLLIGGGTILIYLETTWGFWLALLASFGATVILQAVWLGILYALKAIKTSRKKA